MEGVAVVAAALADTSRVAMLDVLLDGQAHSAGDLAQAAGVAPSTASEHLSRLARARLVEATRNGRRRLYVLATPAVAEALEALSALSEPQTAYGLRNWTRMELLRAGRTCYDHLAGRLGVALTDAARASGALTTDLGLGKHADEWFARLGVDLEALPHGRRPLLRACVDWTEKREHLAGTLGAAVCSSLLSRGWIERRSNTRAVAVTRVGAVGLRDLGADVEPAVSAVAR
jgi:DNA-binding transcriptional ArsR family regulator